MKHETLISVTILSVVTTVVIGVWSNGFGLFSHRVAVPVPTAVGVHGPISLFPSVNAVNGVDFPGGLQAEALPAATPGNLMSSAATPGNPMNSAATPGNPMSSAAIADPIPLDGALETVPPKAPNYIPSSVQLYEAHWQGMDTRLLTGELRRKLRFPQGLNGVLVGEVSLEAGRSGLLGGDVIVAVEGQPVTSLESFQEATRLVADRTQATIEALRKTGPKDRTGNRAAMVRLTLTLVAERALGFAQVEGAPMIKAGDPRPHPDRGPCTQCHSIGRGFELTPDPDLITLPPPVLTRDQAAKGIRPHEDRGPCQACHVITP